MIKDVELDVDIAALQRVLETRDFYKWPYEVDSEVETSSDLENWLNQHCLGRFTIRYTGRYISKLKFELEHDFVLFQMTWG